MKKAICVALLCMVVLSVFCGVIMSTVSADENYNDISNEYSDGPGEPPEDGMLREEPRTRFKDD
jgi:hypothetical protein